MKRSAFGIAAAACLIALGGCSLAPEYQRPELPAAQAFKEDGPWAVATPSDQQQRAAWWTLYGDPVLSGLESRIDVANPDLAAAAARYAQARAYLDQSRSGLFPQLGVDGLTTHNRQSDHRPLRSASQPDEYKDDAIGAQLGYELDLWGRVRNLVAAGKATADATEADLASVRLSLHAELADAYISLRALDAELALLTDTVDAYKKALDLTQNRFSGGIASGLDVARAHTQLDTAHALMSDVRAQRAQYEHAIASLIGETASSFSLATNAVTLPTPAIPLDVPSRLLERRPDIAAAERRVAAANASIGVARAAFFPDIVLSASGGYETTGSNAWLTAPNTFWSIGPHLTLPIFDAGRRRAIEAQAQAVFDEATDRYRSVALAAFQQVEDNLALLHWLGEEEKDQAAAVHSAQQTLDLAMDRYRNGAVNYLEVVDSQITSLAAQRAELRLRNRQLQASVGLIRALGGGWSIADIGASAARTAAAQVPASR